MSDLDAFLKTLDQTVRASRLSGTKVKELSSSSKSLSADTDTKVVSTFLKLNNSLAHCGQSRISSLYVFDAVARANKGLKGREGFLSKMEGVVESWVGGMLEDGKGGVWTEGKEKTRKIIEIWTKNGTFPPPCLDRLSKRLAVATPVIESTTPPFSPTLPPLELKGNSHGDPAKGTASSSSTPPPAPGSLPPEIQKLLGIAAIPQLAAAAATSAPIQNTNFSQSAPAPVVDLAAILAGLAKPQPAQALPSALTSVPTLPGFNLDPSQLAALANLAKGTTVPLSAPVPTHNGHAPGPSNHAGSVNLPPFPPQVGPSHDRPPQGYGPPQGYRSPPRRGSRDGHARNQSNDSNFARFPGSGPSESGRRERSRSPPKRNWEDRERAEPMRGSGDWGERQDRSNRGDGDGRRGRGGGRGGRGGRDGPPDNRSRDGGYGPRPRGPPNGSPQQATFPLLGDSGSHQQMGRPGFQSHNSGSQTSNHQRLPVPPPQSQQPTGRAPLPSGPGKDEFGRDLPTNENGEEDMALDDEEDDDGPKQRQQQQQTQNQTFQLPPPPHTQQQNQNFSQPQPQQQAQRQGFQQQTFPAKPKATLETFDRTSFNPADPSSWSALAEAWQASMGRQPDQMELMQYLAMGMGGQGGTGGGMGGSGFGNGGF